jgi:SET and MYND domain-containing protein
MEEKQTISLMFRFLCGLLEGCYSADDESVDSQRISSHPFFSLHSHEEDVPAERKERVEVLANICFAVGSSVPFFSSSFSESLLLSSLCRSSCNNFTIYDSELFPVAVGIFPSLSILNHSCMPNAVLMYRGCAVEVRALREIEEGDEICHSYVDSALPYSKRQMLLFERYFFSCKCARCLTEGSKEQNGGEGEGERENRKILWPWQALVEDMVLLVGDENPLCSSSLPFLSDLPLITYESVTKKFLEMKDHRRFSDLERHRILKGFADFFAKYLSPLHIHSLSSSQMLIESSISLSEWKDAIVACERVISIYQRAYPPSHPLIGLQIFTFGKILWNNFETERSLAMFQEAKKLLCKLLHEDDPVMTDLNKNITDARYESIENSK